MESELASSLQHTKGWKSTRLVLHGSCSCFLWLPSQIKVYIINTIPTIAIIIVDPLAALGFGKWHGCLFSRKTVESAFHKESLDSVICSYSGIIKAKGYDLNPDFFWWLLKEQKQNTIKKQQQQKMNKKKSFTLLSLSILNKTWRYWPSLISFFGRYCTLQSSYTW